MQFLFRRVLPIVLLMVTVWMTITPAEAAMFKFSGQRPNNLGVQNGRLQSCPNTPNCVSSEATDSEHQIADLKYLGDDTIATIKAIVLAQPGAAVISETGDYLYAEFTSKLMGFVDDVEFYVDRNAQTVKVRSASRLGQSDLGVNRKRVETIRSLM